ncbi:MAG: TIR domain-containing protein [Rhodocyclaceae bacterium]|nr:TIR domain-containing protein [Rhodocyclaceae bacterium]
MADFFVSYNKDDAGWAQWIAWQVEEAGYSVLIQAWDFLPGQDWVRNMDQALLKAPRLLAVQSPSWRASRHAQAEWREYYRIDPDSDRALILPVRVHAFERRGLLGGHVYVDLVGSSEADARARLLAGLRAVQPLPGPRPQADPRRQKPLVVPPFPAAEGRTPQPVIDYSNLVRRLPPLQQVEDELYSIAFSRSGEWLAAGSHCTVVLWNLLDPAGQAIASGRHGSYVYSVAFSHDDLRLVTGGEDGYVRVWSVDPLKLLWERREHTEAVYSVAFSSDGSRVASGGYDGRVLFWDADEGEPRRSGGSAVEGIGRVTSVAFSPDDRLLAIGSLRDTVWLLDIEVGEARELGRHQSSVESVAFAPDGKTLASCGLDKAVCVWDVSSTDHAPRWRKREHDYLVRSVAYAPDGRTLASVGWDKRLNLWDVETGELLLSKPMGSDSKWHSDWIWSVAFSHDGQMLASGGSDGRIVAWKVKAGKRGEKGGGRAGGKRG